MNQYRSSVYRYALQVSSERIAMLGDEHLDILMNQLLQAQAYKCGSPPNQVRVNTEGKANDDGCDGWTSEPLQPDDWLGTVDTCWQFKAGSAGQPARLSGEVLKPIPRETLGNGGRFVVVCSGSTSGKNGEEDRLVTLINEATAVNIPTTRIEVLGSERLANWCNQHPAIAAYWAGRPDGLWTLDDWLSSDEHQVPYQASATVELEIDARRAELDFEAGDVHHLHIKGPPGVGKTRFALELCRGAAWSGAVIYIRQAEDIRLIELIDCAAKDPGVELMVVADEVQHARLRALRDSVGRGDGRVRLITIGHCSSPDPRRIPALSVMPLDDTAMSAVIGGWYPTMPPEHIDFVVNFSDGYVRLARLAADAVIQDPAMDVRRLLDRDEIRDFLNRMLGTIDRRALYIVAALTRVGWTDDKQEEGEAIAEHFGLDWNDVRATVEDFHRRYGITPRGGRFRYISPVPLGIHLASEAWGTYPDLMRSLHDILPSDEARDAYYERLQSMASSPQAEEYAREELRFFFHIDDFLDVRAARRYSALSAADPDEAARNTLRILSRASIENRKRIKGQARREMVWMLTRIAWRSSSFHDAAKALALLAEAENEAWANNATSEFVARFQIFLGGTAVPYLDRLSVLDELLAEDRPSLARIVVQALAQVSNRRAFRTVSDPASDELPEREWEPHTRREYSECIEAAIARLSNVAKLGITDIQADIVSAAQDLSILLRESSVREFVANFFDVVRGVYPESREPLRRAIADIIHSEREYWQELPAEELEELETLHARFQGSSLGARLQQYVGQKSWDQEAESDLSSLAEQLVSTPESLSEHWPWLTSGDASEAWQLGKALAKADPDGELIEVLSSLPVEGDDLRLVCGYVNARRRVLGDEWYDDWVTSQAERDPRPIPLLFEVAWRCGFTDATVDVVVETLRNYRVSPQIVGRLKFSRWSETLSLDAFEAVLYAMADTEHYETAIAILKHRMDSHPTEADFWKPIALQLVTTSDLIRSRQMTGYYWKEVACTIITDYPGEIAAAILREQGDRESGVWFAEFGDAAGVLSACAKQDPGKVWQAMQPYLASGASSYSFIVGFPKGVIEHLPVDDVEAWIAEQPEKHGAIVARVADKDFSSDETLASRVIGEYGDNEQVASAFFSEYVSGSWWGPASSHWEQLAETLDGIASRTALPKLRRWASDSSRALRSMAERDRKQEEEEELQR